MSVTYRAPVYCENGVVATPHYLASFAGASVLREGGNAVDAAIAANAVVGVTWPNMCGIGGDLFMLVYWAKTGELFGLSATGHSSARASLDAVRAQGHTTIPVHSGLAVAVPGAVDGWTTAHERFGSRDLAALLAPAIRYAGAGFPISAFVCQAISDKLPVFQRYPDSLATYAPGGAVPRPADHFANPDLARTLTAVAERGRAGFYEGEVAANIARAICEAGGVMDPEDVAAQHSRWVSPIRGSYRGLEICEMPPPTQGLAAIEMANLLDGFDIAAGGRNTPETIHLMVEAKRLAFADRAAYVCDPAHLRASVDWLTSAEYANERRREINPRRAMQIAPIGPLRAHGDTIYLCAADGDGNCVSLIQSLFHNFGSGVVAGGTGVVLANRAAGFVLDPEHPNALGPRKLPFTTLIPAMALRDGKPFLVYGSRGADGQPQTQTQVLSNVVDFGLNPQAAVEAPRWVHGGPASHHPPETVVLESRIPDAEGVAAVLREMGHQVLISSELDLGMGTAQAIQVDHEHGVLMAGSDPRGDGAAIGL